MHRSGLARRRLPRRGVEALVAGLAVAAAATGVVLATSDRGGGPVPGPRSEEDVVVQAWWRATYSPAASITGCRPLAADRLVGGTVWACELWYPAARRGATVCVSIAEHVVQRRIRGAPPGGRTPTCA